MFIDTGPTGSRPAELVKPAGNAVSQMRPEVLSEPQRVYKHATPDGVGNVVGKVRRRELNTTVLLLNTTVLLTEAYGAKILADQIRANVIFD